MTPMIYYSIIIPHHNTPHLLQRLIDTIPQREDIEIIVVDDNSVDDKKADISRPDVKTIFIDKEHTRGAGHARNIGMDAATGKWLLFADSDDFYKPNFIHVLDEYRDDDIEMLFWNVESVDSDTLLPGKVNRSLYHQKMIENYDGSENSKNNLLFLGFGPWRKMLLTSYVKKYGFQFEEIPKDNDHLFSLETSYFAKNWKVDNRVLYVLTFCEGSITYGNMTKDKYIAHFLTLRRRSKLYCYMGHPEWNKRCVRGRYFQSGVYYCYKMFKKKPKEGLRAMLYYITNFISIEIKSNYYVEVFERLKTKNKAFLQ